MESSEGIFQRVEQRLQHYEISPVLFEHQWYGRRNILISNPDPISINDDLWTFRCHQMAGGLPLACNLGAPVETFIQPWRKGMIIEVLTKEPLHQLLQKDAFALLFDVELVFEDPIYFAKLDCNSAVKVWDLETPLQPGLRMMDIFCGGFGGWSFGACATKQIGMTIQTVACLDCDRFAVANHCANHEGSIFSNVDFVVDAPRNLPIHIAAKADPKTVLWLSQKTRANAFAISFPCQPWSKSGRARGFGDGNGLLAIDALGFIRLARPPVAFLENVSSIGEHAHYQLLVKCIQWSGYRVCWEEKIDIARWTCASRNRWIAVLIDEYRPNLMFQQSPIASPTVGRMTLGSCESVLQSIPGQIYKQLCLDDRLKTTYGDPAMAKSLASVTPWSTPKQVLQARIVDQHAKAGTFMAQYGNQHALPHDLLRQQGIHAQFVEDSLTGDPRFFAPHEIAMCMPVVNRLILPVQCRSAWRFVGNCISPLHAAIAINVAYNGLFGCDFDVGHTIQFILTNRLTDGNSCLHIHGDRAILSKNVATHENDDQMEHSVATQLFQPQIDITVHTHESVHQVTSPGDLDVSAICSLHAINKRAKVIYKYVDGNIESCHNEVISMHGTILHLMDFRENFNDDDYRTIVSIRMMMHSQRLTGSHQEPILLQIKWKDESVYQIRFDPNYPCDKLRDHIELAQQRNSVVEPFEFLIGTQRLQCRSALGLFANNGIVKLQCLRQVAGSSPK